MENNTLQQIEPGALEGLGKLEVLQLQGNQLQQLPQGLGEQAVAFPGVCDRLVQVQWACGRTLCESIWTWLVAASTQ
jgi:hypothetical protein